MKGGEGGGATEGGQAAWELARVRGGGGRVGEGKKP